jgi:hypothetical protein
MRLFWPGLLLAITGLLLAACGTSKAPAYELAPSSTLPEFVQNEPPAVRDAYRFAIANPDELAKYPCYCGCGAMGHTSNLSCYISEVGADGQISFDNHAAGCGICVDITQDVMRLMNEGQSSQQIRAYVDAQYSAFGPSTNTPLPSD